MEQRRGRLGDLFNAGLSLTGPELFLAKPVRALLGLSATKKIGCCKNNEPENHSSFAKRTRIRSLLNTQTPLLKYFDGEFVHSPGKTKG